MKEGGFMVLPTCRNVQRVALIICLAVLVFHSVPAEAVYVDSTRNRTMLSPAAQSIRQVSRDPFRDEQLKSAGLGFEESQEGTPGGEEMPEGAIPSPTFRYTIGTQDVLYISVWEEPDLSTDVIVRPDGMISFPLVGDVQAVGRTITELDADLTERLKEYVKYPEISISIKKLGGKKVIVLGEVFWPGVYSLSGHATVLEAISLARGCTIDGVFSSVIVVRNGPNGPRAIRLNLSKCVMQADLSQNIVLQSEDIVYVPRKFIRDVNYFMTQLLGPVQQGLSTVNIIKGW